MCQIWSLWRSNPLKPYCKAYKIIYRIHTAEATTNCRTVRFTHRGTGTGESRIETLTLLSAHSPALSSVSRHERHPRHPTYTRPSRPAARPRRGADVRLRAISVSRPRGRTIDHAPPARASVSPHGRSGSGIAGSPHARAPHVMHARR